MTIAILCCKNQEEHQEYEWFCTAFIRELLAVDPSLKIQCWPAITDYNVVTCVLAFKQPPSELKKFPNLKAIFSLGAGVDHLLSDPTVPDHLPITRIVDPMMARDITHYAITAVLNHIRLTSHWHLLQQQKIWYKHPPFNLAHKTLGIMGLGFLGRSVAEAAVALQIKTIGWSRSQKHIPSIHCYTGEDEFIPFLQATDILVCLVPYTPITKNKLNHSAFAALRDEAYVINIARGPIVVDNDLLDALNQGKLSGACLDVFHQEPLEPNHPFWSHPKITVTPHIASVTDPATAALQLVENYHRLMQNQPLNNCVDRE